MPRKKPDKTVPADEDQELIRRVDAMMGVEPADGSAPAAAGAATEQSGAPELPADLLKKVKPVKSDDEPPREKLLKISGANDEPIRADSSEIPEAPAAPAGPIPTVDPEPKINLEDAATDQAVDDIAAKDSDTILALEDIKRQRSSQAAEPAHHGSVWKRVFGLIVLMLVVVGLLLVYGYTQL